MKVDHMHVLPPQISAHTFDKDRWIDFLLKYKATIHLRTNPRARCVGERQGVLSRFISRGGHCQQEQAGGNVVPLSYEKHTMAVLSPQLPFRMSEGDLLSWQAFENTF